MSNQASEYALKEITKILLMYKAHLAYEQVEPQHEWLGSIDIEEAKLDLLALIRTEKLKLLAEARERVVGEYETEYSNLDGDAGYWEKHGRNGMREKQIAKLTKMEDA